MVGFGTQEFWRSLTQAKQPPNIATRDRPHVFDRDLGAHHGHPLDAHCTRTSARRPFEMLSAPAVIVCLAKKLQAICFFCSHMHGHRMAQDTFLSVA